MSFQERQIVVLEQDLPAESLRRGDVGTVVLVHDPDGLEVEFANALGRTLAVVTVRAADVRPAVDEDRLAVRPGERSA